MAMKKCVSRNKRKQDQEKTAELILQVVSGECCAPQNRLENFLYICPLRRAFPGENGSAQHSPDTTESFDLNLRRVGTRREAVDTTIIQSDLDGISAKLDGAVKSILAECRKQRRAPLKEIEAKYDEQSAEALKIIQESIRTELGSRMPPSERDDISSRLTDLVMYTFHQMGKY